MGDIEGRADWSRLHGIDFSEGLDTIWTFSELGRGVALHSIDPMDAALQDLYETLLATPWLGGRSREGRAKAKRLLRPLQRTTGMGLPAAARRFAQLPGRFRGVYDTELHPGRTSSGRSGMPNPNGNR